MILDSIENIDNYKCLNSRVYRALEIIRNTDFCSLEDNTYLVDGFNFRFFIMSYQTQKANDKPEAHRDFIDVQYIISGKEQIGIAQLEDMTEEVEANPQKDIWFYHGPTDYVSIREGMFAVFFPNDAHAPNIAHPDGCNAVRKCVFKVHI